MKTIQVENTIHYFPNNDPQQHELTEPCHCPHYSLHYRDGNSLLVHDMTDFLEQNLQGQSTPTITIPPPTDDPPPKWELLPGKLILTPHPYVKQLNDLENRTSSLEAQLHNLEQRIIMLEKLAKATSNTIGEDITSLL